MFELQSTCIKNIQNITVTLTCFEIKIAYKLSFCNCYENKKEYKYIFNTFHL